MPAEAIEQLARHSKRSRVIWHPGSTPPYSSLWMTVQRFLILNQPARAAFMQDFGVRNHGRTTIQLDANQAGGVRCPIRLLRFTRVLGEPMESLRYCHTSQFSKDAGRYFGDFAVCPQCLGEGFHSILFSFKALRECPVHRTEFWFRNGDKSIPSPKLFNELLRPYVRYGWEQYELEYSTTRNPKANSQRDGALGEVADWLMNIGLRYWICPSGVHAGEVPLQDFTERIVDLKTAMGLPAALPSWVAARDDLPLGPTTVETAKFGTMKVTANCVHERVTSRQNIDLYLYYKTLLCDFKAIHRYLKRQMPPKARRWLARLGDVVDAMDIDALLQLCDLNVRTAWALVLWRRTAGKQGFDSNARIASRPFWLALDQTIPTWSGMSGSNPSDASVPDLAHLWLVRWISAAGLLRFWRSVHDSVAHQSRHQLVPAGFRTAAASLEVRWGVGISEDNVLTLCLSNDMPDALVHAGTLL
jgi:hypothetical protein